MNEPLDEPVGSAAEEAAKLLGAVADWAREHGGSHLGDGLGSAAPTTSTSTRHRRGGVPVVPGLPGRPGRTEPRPRRYAST